MTSIFLETRYGVECIQALKVAKLIGIKNVTQFIVGNNIDSVKGGDGRGFPWYVTVTGAMQMLIKRDFGGNMTASKFFHDLDRFNDEKRVCKVLEFLEEFNPGTLELKPRGRRVKESPRLSA